MSAVDLRLQDIAATFRPGRVRATPVMLVHGQLVTRRSLTALLDVLDAPVAAVDLPGHGETGGRVQRFSDFADGVIRAADALGWPGFHVVGHSLGAMVALDLARRVPERVGQVLLMCPPGPVEPQHEAMFRGFAGAMAGGFSVELMGNLVERWYSPEFIAGQPGLVERVRERVTRDNRLEEASAVSLAIAGAPDLGAGGPLTRVEVIQCSADASCPASWARPLLDALGVTPDRVATLPGGHFPMEERPDELLALVRAWGQRAG